MPTSTVTLPDEIAEQLDALARARGSNSQDIALQAIRAYIDDEDDRRLTREALAELDRGEGIPAEQVTEDMIALLEAHGVSRLSQERIRGSIPINPVRE
ncbi:MAG TPA: ribbon-helix-helix protein, CopG family [Chloroflexota bacterium]|jgi:predicted transcriptional regulator